MQQYQNAQPREVELDLKRIFMAVWKQKVLVILVTAIFCLGSYLYSVLCLTPLYQTSFTAYINNRITTESTTTSANDLNASMGLMYVYREVVQSRSVLVEAAEKCGYEISYETLSKMVQCETPEDVPVFKVVVSAPSPEMAHALAKAVSEVAPSHLSYVLEGSSMRIIDDPVMPKEKFWPSNTANGIKGGLAAFAVCCLALIVLDLVKDKVQGVEELERRYQLPIIGSIPDLEQAEKKRGGYYGYGKKGGKR